MHNFLLRYYVAEAGLNPDTDIQIRVVPPPEMVANLRAGNIDGYLGPDPFNQRAVFEEIGFIHLLTKELWNGHPCCAFGSSTEFIEKNPNTFAALVRSVLTASAMARDPKNRELIAKVIAPAQYLNQPETVLMQVLTGKFADGLGNIRTVPDRADFDPIPWQSMAVWMLTQMKRWGYVKGDINYKQIAEKVFLLTDAKKRMKDLGQAAARWRLPQVHDHGQGVRSGEARRLRQELRHLRRWPPERMPKQGPLVSRRRWLSLLMFLLPRRVAGWRRTDHRCRPPRRPA